MLTWRDLEAMCRAKTLWRWTPGGRKQPTDGRCLYLLDDVREAFIARPWPGAEGRGPGQVAVRRGAMLNVLERYVEGLPLRVNADIKELGTKRRDANMRGYWEFRSQGPRTQTRLFGFFARPGAFLATAFEPRDIYQDPADWLAQRRACQQRWNAVTRNAKFCVSPWPVETRASLQAYLEITDGP
jgi:hypothetical protein